MAIGTVDLAIQRFGSPVYVYHDIVHNNHVVADLRTRGAVFVDDIDDVPRSSTIVFSAHGVAPSVRRRAEQKRLFIIDATCPLVARVHTSARRHVMRNRHMVLVGHVDHDEVIGTVGEAPDSITVVSTVGDVHALDLPPDSDIAYLTQTTLSQDDASELISLLRDRFPQIVGPSQGDICYATQNRQNAVKRLAGGVDIALIVGSDNSSNSNRLREVVAVRGPQAYLVDDASGINDEWFNGTETVLITAGASAPEAAVQNVVRHLVKTYKANVIEQQAVDEPVQFPLPPEVRGAVRWTSKAAGECVDVSTSPLELA
jgi:4-hydroxy-3-methylbut-2-enyl diphosphate reductase